MSNVFTITLTVNHQTIQTINCKVISRHATTALQISTHLPSTSASVWFYSANFSILNWEIWKNFHFTVQSIASYFLKFVAVFKFSKSIWLRRIQYDKLTHLSQPTTYQKWLFRSLIIDQLVYEPKVLTCVVQDLMFRVGR